MHIWGHMFQAEGTVNAKSLGYVYISQAESIVGSLICSTMRTGELVGNKLKRNKWVRQMTWDLMGPIFNTLLLL